MPGSDEMASIGRRPDSSSSDSSSSKDKDKDKDKDKHKDGNSSDKDNGSSSGNENGKGDSASSSDDKGSKSSEQSDDGASDKGGKSGADGKSVDAKNGKANKPITGEDDSESGLKKKKGKGKGDAKDNLVEKLKKKLAKTAAAAGARAGVAMAMKMALMKMLLMLIQAVQAAVAAVASAIAAIIATVVQVVTAVATALAVGFAVAAFGIGAIVAIVVVVVAVAVYDAVAEDPAVYDGVPDCSVDISAYTVTDVANATDEEKSNAQLAYSVLSVYGLSDSQIAGVLGNMHCEGGIDPTAIEDIYNEKYNINGPIKQFALAQGWDAYTRSKGHTSDGYKAADGNYYCGIGLMQFTADNNIAVREFAAANSQDWWTMGPQLGFMLQHYASDWAAWADTGSVDDASDYFCNVFEKPLTPNYQDRRDAAAEYYTLMGEWVADTTYANSIITMANATTLDGTTAAGSNALNECKQAIAYDNSSIAAAALNLAWSSESAAQGNNGTGLYQYVNHNIWQDSRYQECARLVSTAVAWSGADDSYPKSGCANQLTHLVGTPSIWQEITFSSASDVSNLMPGDIFICTTDISHTFVYVGNDLAKSHLESKGETWTNQNIVEAAYHYDSCDGNNCPDAQSPHIDHDDLANYNYRVFRCKQKTGTLYRSAAVGYVE